MLFNDRYSLVRTVNNQVGDISVQGIIPYGVCDTAGDTAAKTVTVSPTITTLTEGQLIFVKFTNANTAEGATLNVNSTGAKGIILEANVNVLDFPAYSWSNGQTIFLRYDGTSWVKLTHGITPRYSAPGIMTVDEKERLDNIFSLIYPVGAIYISTSSTSPASLFGGTWTQISGRFLIGTGNVDANSNNYWGGTLASAYNLAAGEKGGESVHTLTEAQLPQVTGSTVNAAVFYWDGGDWYTGENVQVSTSGAFSVYTFNNETIYPTSWSNTATGRKPAQLRMSFGSGNPHSNMPPYLSVYMWQRTA